MITHTLNYRTLASSPAREPFKKINATIDVQEFTVYSNEYREKIGKVIEIKFAE